MSIRVESFRVMQVLAHSTTGMNIAEIMRATGKCEAAMRMRAIELTRAGYLQRTSYSTKVAGKRGGGVAYRYTLTAQGKSALIDYLRGAAPKARRAPRVVGALTAGIRAPNSVFDLARFV